MELEFGLIRRNMFFPLRGTCWSDSLETVVTAFAEMGASQQAAFLGVSQSTVVSYTGIIMVYSSQSSLGKEKQ